MHGSQAGSHLYLLTSSISQSTPIRLAIGLNTFRHIANKSKHIGWETAQHKWHEDRSFKNNPQDRGQLTSNTHTGSWTDEQEGQEKQTIEHIPRDKCGMTSQEWKSQVLNWHESLSKALRKAAAPQCMQKDWRSESSQLEVPWLHLSHRRDALEMAVQRRGDMVERLGWAAQPTCPTDQQQNKTCNNVITVSIPSSNTQKVKDPIICISQQAQNGTSQKPGWQLTCETVNLCQLRNGEERCMYAPDWYCVGIWGACFACAGTHPAVPVSAP